MRSWPPPTSGWCDEKIGMHCRVIFERSKLTCDLQEKPMSDMNGIIQSLMTGDSQKLNILVQEALDNGTPAGTILNEGLIRGMDIIGGKMESGQMYIPEVLYSAKAMGSALEILKPMLAADEVSASGKVVIGTVKGDLHDIGKNLVIMMLKSSGFEVIDLGVDNAPENFLAAVKENNPDLVGLSALLTTTTHMMKETINAIDESGLRNEIKIMVGGAPVTQTFADQIGADGYAPDAGAALKLAKELKKK
jgi:5-methyltetrahydrofolate--homocysteine methyltransferase